MGHSLGKDPSEVQQAVIQMPQSQAITAAQSVPGPYMASQDPFNYTGFTTYDNGQPITGYDWWAPGNPTVTQSFGQDKGSVTTNPVTTPRAPQPVRNNAYYSQFFQRVPGLGYNSTNPAPTMGTGNFENTAGSNNPALQSYIDMMGGPNNYGAVIGQGQQQQTPQTSAPPASSPHPGTRYGAWDDGQYKPILPWGLAPYSIEGEQFIGFGPNYEPTPLKWDFSTGHLVGGDEQADAYRTQWESYVRPGGHGLNRGRQGSGTGTGTIAPQTPQTPFWWESAMDPNFTHSAYLTYAPNGESTWNFSQPLPAGVANPPDFWNVSYFGQQPTPTSPPPTPNLGLGGGGGFGGGGAPPPPVPGGGGGGGGGGYASGGYGAGHGGNPWGGLNGIEDAMTSASAFGRRRRRG